MTTNRASFGQNDRNSHSKHGELLQPNNGNEPLLKLGRQTRESSYSKADGTKAVESRRASLLHRFRDPWSKKGEGSAFRTRSRGVEDEDEDEDGDDDKISPLATQPERKRSLPNHDVVFEEVLEVEDFLRWYVEEYWAEYTAHIRIRCRQQMTTFQDIQDIARMEQNPGTKACQQLLHIPVLSDRIGNHLWQWLAKDINGQDHLEKLEQSKVEAAEKLSRECLEYFTKRQNGEDGREATSVGPLANGNGKKRIKSAGLQLFCLFPQRGSEGPPRETNPHRKSGGKDNAASDQGQAAQENGSPRRWRFPFLRRQKAKSMDSPPITQADTRLEVSDQRRRSLPTPPKSTSRFSNVS